MRIVPSSIWYFKQCNGCIFNCFSINCIKNSLQFSKKSRDWNQTANEPQLWNNIITATKRTLWQQQQQQQPEQTQKIKVPSASIFSFSRGEWGGWIKSFSNIWEFCHPWQILEKICRWWMKLISPFIKMVKYCIFRHLNSLSAQAICIQS